MKKEGKETGGHSQDRYNGRQMEDSNTRDLKITRDHRRQWRECVYVYPVVSRRAKGLSVGVNLNLNKACTFDCVYCQINRRVRRRGLSRGQIRRLAVDLDVLGDELQLALTEAVTGRLWKQGRFAETPPGMRRINDIAFSGDGEPTCLAQFDQAVQTAADVKQSLGLDDTKIVVITNATQMDRGPFQRAIPILKANNGEVWAKLDAGTEEMFQRVNRPRGRETLEGVCRGITGLGRQMPVVIQSLFLKLRAKGPSVREINDYCDRVDEILAGGAAIKQVQVHTIARNPADPSASWLCDAELDRVAAAIRRRLPELTITVTYGADAAPQQR